MSSEFAYEFLQAMKPEAWKRVRPPLWKRLVRFLFTRRDLVDVAMDRPVTPASYFTALSEAGERMSPAERERWREDGTLREGFWEWVEARAAYWDSLPG